MNEIKQFTCADGVRIAYCESGQSDVTLAFVHGWSCNRQFFKPQITHFAGNYHVLAPDLPGHGESDHNREAWDIEHFARDLAALVEAEARPHCVLIGHSMAGAVVLEAVKYCSDKVKAVVMADTHVFDYGHLNEKQIDEFLTPMGADLPGFIDNLVDSTLPEQRPAGLENWIKQQMYSARPEVALPLFESLLRWDAMPSLNQVGIPIFDIHGSLINKVALERYREKIRSFAMAEAGHFLQLENPEMFNRILQRALSESQS